MPIHLKGRTACLPSGLQQQPRCPDSNMQIATHGCDGDFQFLLDFGSAWKSSGGPRGFAAVIEMAVKSGGGAQVWLVIPADSVQDSGLNTVQSARLRPRIGTHAVD